MSYLTIYRGDDRTLTVAASSPIQGSDMVFTAKRHRRDADADAVIQKSTADGGITVIGDEATITIDAADTDSLDDSPALFWDVQVTDTDGKTLTVATGRLAILRDITRTVPAS
jgi:hypothetical protein